MIRSANALCLVFVLAVALSSVVTSPHLTFGSLAFSRDTALPRLSLDLGVEPLQRQSLRTNHEQLEQQIATGQVNKPYLLNRNWTCVVAHSQHKSAGATLGETLVRDWLGSESTGCAKAADCLSCDVGTWDCSRESCRYSEKIEAGRYLALNGYVGVLAFTPKYGSAGMGPCLWITISREPVARLISALFYCTYGKPSDALCAMRQWQTTNRTYQASHNRTGWVRDFALHWGNYLFRELLWHPDLMHKVRSRSDFDKSVGLRVEEKTKCGQPPWLRLKQRMSGGDSLTTTSGQTNFQMLVDHLVGRNRARPLYDLFGVLDMPNETFAMLNSVLPLRASHSSMKGGWKLAFKRRSQSHGSQNWKADENAATAEARKDPVVLHAISADLKLYNDFIVPNFKNVAAQFGVLA